MHNRGFALIRQFHTTLSHPSSLAANRAAVRIGGIYTGAAYGRSWPVVVDHARPDTTRGLRPQSISLDVDASAALKARFAFSDQVGAHRQYFDQPEQQLVSPLFLFSRRRWLREALNQGVSGFEERQRTVVAQNGRHRVICRALQHANIFIGVPLRRRLQRLS